VVKLPVDWITMKRSSIPNGGFGIFTSRSFNIGEFITFYLGEMVPLKYPFSRYNCHSAEKLLLDRLQCPVILNFQKE
jgi:hypothetical protein